MDLFFHGLSNKLEVQDISKFWSDIQMTVSLYDCYGTLKNNVLSEPTLGIHPSSWIRVSNTSLVVGSFYLVLCKLSWLFFIKIILKIVYDIVIADQMLWYSLYVSLSHFSFTKDNFHKHKVLLSFLLGLKLCKQSYVSTMTSFRQNVKRPVSWLC